MLPASFLQIVGRAVFVALALGLALAVAGVEAKGTRHPSFAFSFRRLVPSSLFLLSSSPSTSAQGQGEASNTHPNSFGKNHRPSTGSFPQPPSPILSDIAASEGTRFSTNRPQKALSPPVKLPPADTTNHNRHHHDNNNSNNGSNDNNTPHPLHPRATKMALSPTLARFPDPIVYEFTLYYPGNMPLIVTAGHGGRDVPGSPVKRRMTHRFTPVDLASPISVPAFSTPVKDNSPDEPQVMPWMPERDRTKGGNFKMDVNTHSAALHLAGAVACIVNEGYEGQSPLDPVPPKCDFADSDDPGSPPPQDTRLQKNISPFFYPHVVVFRVPREFVDVNRNITGENAIADHPVAEAAWKEYHDLIDHVQRIVTDRQDDEPREPSKGLGLLLDIHGHAHATNLIEIGYLLNQTTLALDDKQLDAYANVLANFTSVKSLVSILQQKPTILDSTEDDSDERIAFSEFLRGPMDSLGGMLQSQGLDSLPSPRHQAPALDAVYFYGGYTTQSHGSRDKAEEAMDAIQLEMPRTLRFVRKDEGREIGMRMGRAVVEFMRRYYELPLPMARVLVSLEEDEILLGRSRHTKAWSIKEQMPAQSGPLESGNRDDANFVDPNANSLMPKRQASRL